MKRYSDEFVKKVRKVRKREKLSFVQLGKKFSVPPSTIRNWCRGLVGTRWDILLITNEKKRQELRKSEIKIVPKIEEISDGQAKMFVGLLYGCEGSKYPAHKGVAFSNSDPKLMRAFIKLLSRSFKLDKQKFSIHLQVHDTQDYLKLRTFWSKLLFLPESCFIKPTIRTPQGGKHRENYMGTCTVRYRDYRIQLKLLGIFEKFLNEFFSET